MFSSLVGNDQIKLTLKRLFAKGRIPNSLLLAGDEGVGKRQFALEIARWFVCHERVGDEACGVCSSCTRVDTFQFPAREDRNKDEFEKVVFGSHLDIGTVVRYKRLILVDAIRDLERHANYRPYESTARFFIVDEADKMNDNAANALLKTLEEPPATSYIFLISSRPDSLLPTIRSRCQTLRFAPVPSDEIEKYLIDKRAFSRDEARLTARLARGSIGRAVSINIKKFREAREIMISIVQHAIVTRELTPLLRIAETMNDVKNKDSFEDNLDILQSLIHDVWTASVAGDPERLVNTDLAADLTRLADQSRRAELPRWLAEIDLIRENLTVNINRKIAADALFAGMTT